jgi:hypothetical protein
MVPRRWSRLPLVVSALLSLAGLCAPTTGHAAGGMQPHQGLNHGHNHNHDDAPAAECSAEAGADTCENPTMTAAETDKKQPRQSRRQRQQQRLWLEEIQASEAGSVGEAAHRRLAINPSHANLSFEGYRRQKTSPQINTDYPGLQLINEKPYMFLVNGFLSQVECALMLRKAKEMTPQHSRRAGNKIGKRKSSGAQLHPEEVPEFRARIANLTQQKLAQLQPLKISRYDPGDSFGPHSDAVPRGGVGTDPTDFYGDKDRKALGPKAVPYPGGNRFMTVFVYLNDVEDGGRTRWRKLTYKPSFYENPTPTNVAIRPVSSWDDVTAINIQPKAGMAVVFFPATVPELGGVTDHNVVHEAEEAIVTKYVCQQFIYSHPPVYTALKEGHERPKTDSKPELSIIF